MTHNLSAEMARKRIGRKNIAEALGSSEKTVKRKIDGSSDFSVPEAIKIRDKFFPGMELDYLFANESPDEPNAG